ncbi:MAG: M23 family metallopeptidase [Patescibacteria group bacterium]
MSMRSNDKGFSHILILIVLVVLATVGFAVYRIASSDKKNNPESTQQSAKSGSQDSSGAEKDLKLQNIGIDNIDNIDITTNAVREYGDKGLKGFYVFGDKLGGKDDVRKNPNFEYSSLKPGTKVISAIDGKVTFIKEQTDSGDREVFIQPKDGSVWIIGYDHLVNVKVKKDDNVKAGDIIGEPGIQNNGLRRFEIQINKEENGSTTHYCPSVLLDSSVKDSVLASLLKMQNNWETTTGLDLYSVESQNPVGCVVKTMTLKEAEGN